MNLLIIEPINYLHYLFFLQFNVDLVSRLAVDNATLLAMPCCNDALNTANELQKNDLLAKNVSHAIY